MRRREFVTLLGGAAAWPLAARAQQRDMPVIGFFRSTSRDDSAHLVLAFQQGLRLGGYFEGQNVAIEYRWADNRIERQAALAADLVARKVSVIVSNQGASAAVMAANKTIPYVFVIGGDPVALGLVPSLSRPGGNATGLTFLQETLVPKQLELLRDLVPGTNSMAVLANPAESGHDLTLKAAREAARILGVQLHVASFSSERDLDATFATLVERKIGTLAVAGGASASSRRHRIAALAARHAIPTVYSNREYVVAGGLLSYGPSQTEANRQAGLYVSKILKGTKPADLPVEQQTKFELVINLAAAKSLGIEMPLSLLMRVTEAID